MPLKISSTNPTQAQIMKALTKRNPNCDLPKQRTKLLHKHKNDQTTEKMEKGRKILQNPLQPLITNNPGRSVSLRLDHQTQSLQLHLAFRGLPLTHHPKKNIDRPTYSHLNGSKMNSKKEKFVLKAHYYGKAEDFKRKNSKRGSLHWPKKNQIHRT